MRGRVILRVGDRDVELRLTTNALCWLEEVTGRSVTEIMAGMEASPRFSDVRLLVSAATGDRNLDAVGEMIDEAGLLEVTAKLMASIEAAFPDVNATAKKTKPAAA